MRAVVALPRACAAALLVVLLATGYIRALEPAVYAYDGITDFGRPLKSDPSNGTLDQTHRYFHGSGTIGRFDDRANLAGASARLGAQGLAPRSAGLSGPVRFRPRAGATADEIAQVEAYCQACNRALAERALSPTGRV